MKQLQDPPSPFLSQMLGEAGQTRKGETGEDAGDTGNCTAQQQKETVRDRVKVKNKKKRSELE